MTHVTFTDLCNNLASHLDRVEQDRAELVVMRQNREPVVIVPLADWIGVKETLFVLSSPENARRLRAGIVDAEAGRTAEHDLIEA